jgi:type VI secretion system protein ImpK
VTAEGRGDAEPIAANTTAEGREQNRRIEVVLYRQADHS